MKKRARGRPGYKPTGPHRRKVRLWAAGGIAEEVMAARLKICRNTLRKFHTDDIEFGADTARSENLERLDKAAQSGNVSAQKYLDATFRLAAAKSSFVRPDAPRPALGKKEIAREAAMVAGEESDWGDDLKAPVGSLPN